MSNFRNKMRTLNQPQQQEQSVFADPIMSVPVGSISGRKLTPEEKAALGKPQGLTLSEVNQLTNMGWEPGQAIPENLAAQYRRIVTEAAKELPATAVQAPEAISIEDLPPQQQEQVKAMFREATEAQSKPVTASFNNYSEEVKKVLQNTVSIVDDTAPTEQTATVPEAPKSTVTEHTPTEKHAEKTSAVCLHCGNDPYVREDVDDTDKKMYLIAIGTGTPFTKTYSIFDNLIHVTFRTLRTGEQDKVYQWAAETARKSFDPSKIPYTTYLQETEAYRVFLENVQQNAARAFLALQTISIISSRKDAAWAWEAPEGKSGWLDDWKEMGVKTMDDLLNLFEINVPSSEVVQATKFCFSRFMATTSALLQNANDTSSFWKASH